MNIHYRDAQKNNCPLLAEYIYYASDGVLEYLFKGILPGMTVTQLLTHGLQDEKRYNSYKDITVAEYNQKIVGMIQSYSSIHHRIDDEMKSFLPGERLEKLKEFYNSRVDNSLLINAMFVDQKFRRKGIGNTFISLARKKAKSLDFDKLSLFVLSDNVTAQKVYHSNGFKIIKEIDFKDAAKINHRNGIYLMACDI
ncbi:Acetyltransferase (GNAT) family protein [Desulfotomaculum arcticum]|uniref:Acetyltransferase (GNAT) family protein n=1 Tax=Desulfotruncus arcticus DSM 17038 TaxID=1121424 RepID=A0A1I2VJ31_9FIRM|nr:GNAT family N-acetyltransferase [Desulfotruncus arcticus]SFG89140.1 Acetyltransferase (GNAT) family protein [Desulfotomaculum arcticum] [Desulfotruncus arcticus DSM 17038]